MFDVAVIGGGVIGGAILRELSKYNINSVLLEKESDVAMGASKANSGIVHAGFDAKPNSLKAKFNVLGNKMMKKYTKQLGVDYKNNGSLVVAFSKEDLSVLNELLCRGKQNGVKGLSIINKKKLKKLEPNITETALGALYAKTGGIVCPYELTIASIGNAIDNGATLYTDFEVVNIQKQSDYFIIKSQNGKIINSKIIINACGAGCQKIACMLGDDSIKTGLRKGEYVLIDHQKDFVSHTLFFTPSEKGKGILVSNTVHDNIILGPTADEIDEFSTTTTQEGLNSVIDKAKQMVDNIPFQDTITSFSGVRVYSSDRHDFIIENSKTVNGLINVCGIESPGLTSSPAIAKYVVEELLPSEYTAKENPSFNPYRRPFNYFAKLSKRKKNKVIKNNNTYGNIICRCEKITEGEIIHAIHANPKATNIDAIKRRTRSGMGRCQGGFCQPKVAEVLARELNISLEEITKNGPNSKILVGKSK